MEYPPISLSHWVYPKNDAGPVRSTLTEKGPFEKLPRCDSVLGRDRKDANQLLPAG